MEMDVVPAFSIFSAISEVFVTIAVLYSIISTMRGGKFPTVLLGIVLTFELCVNVVYMAGRAGAADTDHTLTTAMKLFFAGHGILSLGMFIGLAVLYVLSVIDVKSGREAWFRRHIGGSWFFIGLWMISVGSGEAIFFMRFGDALFG